MGVPGQRLRGLVAQDMDGRRSSPTVYSYSYPAGSTTWTCPESGTWRFVLWGGGAGGRNTDDCGGGSGALYIAERFITKGQTVALVVAASVAFASNGVSSTATFPNGEVITAGGGVCVGGTAGGAVTANRVSDVVFAGSPGGTSGTSGTAGLGNNGGAGGAGSGGVSGGAGAPGYGTHRGGAGATQSVNSGGETPGGGGSENAGSGNNGSGGLALIYRPTFRV